MKEKTYTIQVGRDHMEEVPVRELENLKTFMRDFLKKEKVLPLIDPEERVDPPCRQILIYRDAAFDTFTREIETDFNIYIGNDALTGISGQEIRALYLTLRTFLGEDGKTRPDDYSANPFISEKKVTIIPYIPQKRLVSLRENAPCICKRTWLTNENEALLSDFTLTNRFGSFYRIPKKAVLSLYKRIGNLLDSDR